MPDQDPYAVPPHVAEGSAEPHPGADQGVDQRAGSQPKPYGQATAPVAGEPTHPPYGSAASAPGGPSPQERMAVLRRTRVTLLIGMLGLPLAVFVAPVGVALGVLALVRLLKDRSAIRAARLGGAAEVIPLVTAITAIVIGTIVSALIALFSREILDYRACVDAANTVIAENRCDEEFMDALRDRLPG